MVTSTLDLGRTTAQTLKGGGTVSARVLQQRAEGLKDFVRSRGNQKSAIGKSLSSYDNARAKRGLTAAEETKYQALLRKYNDLKAQLAEADELRSYLIDARNDTGLGPPKPPPKEAKAGYDPVAGTYRSGSTTYSGVRGITRDSSGNVKDVLLSRSGKQYTVRAKSGQVVEIIEPRKKELTIGGGYSDVLGDSYSREPPQKVKEVGSFLSSYNREAQYFIVDEKKFIITPNPNVNFSKEQMDYFTSEFGKRGFVKEDGRYIYKEPATVASPSASVFGEVKVEPFDFTKPFYSSDKFYPSDRQPNGEIPSENIGFGDPLHNIYPYTSKDLLDAGAIQYIDEKGKTRIGSPTRIVSSPNELYEEFLFFSNEASPIRKAYRTDYAQGVAEYVREQPWHKDFVIQGPFGGVGPADIVGFTLTIPENYIKSIGAIGTVGRGVVEGMKQSKSGGELSYDYLIKAGDAYAAFPSFLELPQTAAITAMGRTPKSAGGETIKTITKFDGSQSTLMSSKLVDGNIVQSYSFRAGGGFDLVIQNPTIQQTANILLTPAKATAGKIMGSAPVRVISSAGKSAGVFGLTQGVIEVVPTIYKEYLEFTPAKLSAGFKPYVAKERETGGFQFKPITFTLGGNDVFTIGKQNQKETSEFITMARYEGERIGYAFGKGFSKLGEPASQMNIAISTGAGALFGGGLQMLREARPTLDMTFKGGAELTGKVAGSPAAGLRGAVALGEAVFEANSATWFYAGGPGWKRSGGGVRLSELNNSDYRPQAFATFITEKGVNPYQKVKPPVILEPQPLPKPSRQSQILINSYKTAQPRQAVAVQGFKMAAMPKQKARKETIPSAGFNIFGETSKTNTRQADMRLEAIQADIAREAGTTKGELAEAVKQGRGLRQGNLLGLRQASGQRGRSKQGLKSSTLEIPRTGQFDFELIRVPERVTTSQRGRPREPPEQPPVAIPKIALGFPSDVGKKMKKGKKKNPAEQIYAPSLLGVLTGKKEKKVKRAYSGFEIRGVLQR